MPHRLEPDPHQGTHLLASELGLEPAQYDLRTGFYPELLPRLAAHLPAALTLPRPPAQAPLEQHLAAAARPYVVMRWIGALLGSLCPLLTYAVGRRLLGVRECLLAAALVASSSLHQAFALQARPHVAHATLAWLALWGLLRQSERPSAARVGVAAALTALAVGSFQTGLFLLPPALVATVVGRRSRAGRAPWAWAAPAAAGLAAALLLPRVGLTAQGLEVAPGGHGLGLRWLDGTGLRGLVRSLGCYDPVLLLGSAAGAVLSAWALPRLKAPGHRRNAALLLGAYALPYGAVLALDLRTTDRYLMPLLPSFAWLAAFALSRACGRASPQRFAWASALALALPLAVSIKTVALGLRPDTLEQAAAWLDAHVGPDRREVIVTRGLFLPRIGQREALQRRLSPSQRVQSPWLAYQERRADDLPAATLDLRFFPDELLDTPRVAPQPIEHWLDQLPATWIAIEVSTYTHAPGVLTGLGALHDVLAARSTPAAVFSGEGASWTFELPIEHSTTPWRFWRALFASAYGPRIEIYRWEPR